MMKTVVLLLTIGGFVCQSSASCDAEAIQCCLSEFLPLISAEYGFQLTPKQINETCLVADETITCLAEYQDACLSVTDKEQMERSDKSKEVITDLCSSESDFYIGIEGKAACLSEASKEFQQCASKPVKFPETGSEDEDIWSSACCKYKNLLGCSGSISKSKCGEAVSELVQKIVKNVAGSNLDIYCKDQQCINSAVTLTAALWILLLSLAAALYNV